jgi:selenocysteine lyase/cysteine desulfurase
MKYFLPQNKIYSQFPAVKNTPYLNTGTYGIMPKKALRKYISLIEEAEGMGILSSRPFVEEADLVRDRTAGLIGADTEEITFSRNATDGINIVLAGTQWRNGDEIITTDEEHEAMQFPLLNLAETAGVRIKTLTVSKEPQAFIEQLAKACTKRTRLIALSYISCETGTRLPVQAICSMAREHGIETLIDGAQALGAVPVNVRDIGCSYFTSNGHKWLSGPKGTGIFYSQKKLLGMLQPTHVGAGSFSRFERKTREWSFHSSGKKFEYGTINHAAFIGLGYSLDWMDELGWENIYKHIESVGSCLKQKIQNLKGFNLLTPLPYISSSGLVTFTVNGTAAKACGVLAKNFGLKVRYIPHYDAMRISAAHYLFPKDIDVLIDALQHL